MAPAWEETVPMDTEATALLALLLTEGVGYVTSQRVLALSRARGASLAELVDADARALLRWLPSGFETLAKPLHASRAHRQRAQGLLSLVHGAGARVIRAGEPDYPPALATALDEQAPPLLFCRGDAQLLQGPFAAVVGTRTPTDRGAAIASECAHALCREGIGIVSGGADGVDTLAHAAAVEEGAPTVVVLPQGLLTYRPPGHLARALEDGTALFLSQFIPTAPWATHAAVTRNATIAGLARIVCVIEPHREGGSMRTGRCGLQQGKPVLCARRPGADAPLLHAGAKPLADPRGALRHKALLAAWRGAPPAAAPAQLF